MSRAYREAKGDIIWIADCNVWISPSVTGLMVDLLCGISHSASKRKRKYKFVHQLPLAVDVSHLAPPSQQTKLSKPAPAHPFPFLSLKNGGGLLEELFLSTSHAKFYTAISTVAVAPCTVGKSNMFRRSHLDALTQPPSLEAAHVQSPGIDFFSHNICEDHLIGDLLWKSPVPEHVRQRALLEGHAPPTAHTTEQADSSSPSPPPAKTTFSWGNHALLPCPPCIQPLSHLPVATYAARRTRWLRVRKFTVPAATLVEPGTESLVAMALGAFALTTLEWC
ncbi:MAG: hypothetical protein LQ340_004142, partial [Diploschistes diacapsis]